jgi:hypothetical protein
MGLACGAPGWHQAIVDRSFSDQSRVRGGRYAPRLRRMNPGGRAPNDEIIEPAAAVRKRISHITRFVWQALGRYPEACLKSALRSPHTTAAAPQRGSGVAMMNAVQVFSCRSDTSAHADELIEELKKCDVSAIHKAFRLNRIFDLPERVIEIASSLSLEEVVRAAGNVAGGKTMVDTMCACPIVTNPRVR